MKRKRSCAPLLAVLLLACCSLLRAQSNLDVESIPEQLQPDFDTHISPPASGNALDAPLKSVAGLIESGNYLASGDIVRRYLLSHPESADAHYLFGYILYRADKPSESLAEYTSAARLRKPAANDLAVVAMDYVLLHDENDADKWLTMAVKWEPENTIYRYFLGRTKYNENRFAEAIQAFEECLHEQPRDVRAEYNLGLSYAGLGQTDEAAAAYRAAIAWQQGNAHEDPQPYLDLGSLLSEKGESAQAAVFLQKAVALDPRNPKAHEVLGRVYEALGSFAEAEEQLKTAISLSPKIASLHYELARIYKRENKEEPAKEEFARCAALNATHSADSQPTPNPIRRHD